MSALSTTARREYCTELGNALPAPVIDEPEYRERRIITAVEAFEALHPGDANEARLAVLIVLSGAHAAENLRAAGVYCEDFAKSSRYYAQAASMMRQERATRRILAQEQKVRLAVEAVANTATAQSDTASALPPQAEPQAASLLALAAAARLAPSAAPVPPAMQAGSAPPPAQDASPSPEAIANAEAYAQKNIVAAAQIRHDRGVTPQNKAYLRYLTLPTDPAVIDALVRGTSAMLTVLDDVGGEDLDAAA
jgi:hypothetical protein